MKTTTLAFFLSFTFCFAYTYTADAQLNIDSIEKTFTYQHGTIKLKNGIGEINIPDGFKYLDADQSERVLVDLWGNPKTEDISLGMILPENQGIFDSIGYEFNIEYDEIGYVEDKDADDINYDDLLKQLQKETIDENKEREKQGYEPLAIIGWASHPYYDNEKKILHWAKEIKFGDQTVNTLNYNVRILGREGVLILNAIATMPNLALVKKDIPNVLDIVHFSNGKQYKDFDPAIDHVAAWTIGGLVAGKILAKIGFFAVILKFWKLIALAVVAFFGGFWKKFKRKKDNYPSDKPKQLNNN
jgi:uncharacterized membrane-anchored protein